ncbi:MAG: PIN domain-containing protein [Sulfuricellaceae bacterium]|nr:PIN domain-containing protein [Sulfuricellaceae bacterium]
MSDNAFVDSNIWLYAFFLRDGEEALHERAKALIEMPLRYVISDQVIAEVSSNLLRKASMAEGGLVEIVTSFYSRCHVVSPSHEMHLKASRLRTQHQFSYWDSLIVAAALEAGCSVLYSEDMQDGQVIDGTLSIRNPLTAPTLA